MRSGKITAIGPKVKNRLPMDGIHQARCRLDSPTSTSAILNADYFAGEVAAFLKKGRKFVEYAFLLGMNPSAKKSRSYYRKVHGRTTEGQMISTEPWVGAARSFLEFDRNDHYLIDLRRTCSTDRNLFYRPFCDA